MNKHERIALETFLCEWEETLVFDHVIDAILNDDTTKFSVCADFEDIDRETLVDYIQNLSKTIKQNFLPI